MVKVSYKKKKGFTIVHHFVQMYYRFKALVLSVNESLQLLSAEEAAQHSAEIDTARSRLALLVVGTAEKATTHLNERSEVEAVTAAAAARCAALSVELADYCSQYAWKYRVYDAACHLAVQSEFLDDRADGVGSDGCHDRIIQK